MTLVAGLAGIEQDRDPGGPIDFNMRALSDAELEERGVRLLPRNLLEVAGAFAADPLGVQVMDEDPARFYAALKVDARNDYHNTVSTRELDDTLTRF